MDEVEKLIKQLKDPDVSIKKSVVVRSGRARDVRAVEPLIPVLKDDDWDVRWCVAWALGRIGDSRAVGPLIGALKDEVPDVREHALKSLVWIAEKADIDPAEVRGMLQAMVESAEAEDRGPAKRLAAEAYAKIAKAVSERKKADMPGEMLPASIKPPKKGIYRTRRAMAR